jgi:hypothetical protein
MQVHIQAQVYQVAILEGLQSRTRVKNGTPSSYSTGAETVSLVKMTPT